MHVGGKLPEIWPQRLNTSLVPCTTRGGGTFSGGVAYPEGDLTLVPIFSVSGHGTEQIFHWGWTTVCSNTLLRLFQTQRRTEAEERLISRTGFYLGFYRGMRGESKKGRKGERTVGERQQEIKKHLWVWDTPKRETKRYRKTDSKGRDGRMEWQKEDGTSERDTDRKMLHQREREKEMKKEIQEERERERGREGMDCIGYKREQRQGERHTTDTQIKVN